ncbi:hypothetical protein AB0N73_14315 [Microbacterium sp. NPDC089189]|uniref:hypothetical protein n=1 Tax=Microbacterium sp. NPDC089189 TaxID=3154972 RepID=UPI00343377E3
MKRAVAARGAGVGFLVLAASVVMSGCGIGTTCSAVGWINTMTVEVSGDASRVADVQVCTPAGCSPTDPAELLSDPSIPAPQGDRGGTWTFSLDMSVPESVTVRALSAEGEVLAETDAALKWQRVGGSDQCGGPAETAPVRLVL